MLAIELPVIQVLTPVFWVVFLFDLFLNVLVCVVSHVVELQHLFQGQTLELRLFCYSKKTDAKDP